jgi:hypothetical protein
MTSTSVCGALELMPLIVIVQPGRIGWVRLYGASPKVVHQLRIHPAGSIPVYGHPRVVDSLLIVLPLGRTASCLSL